MCFFMMGWGTHWPAFLYPLLLRNIINQSGVWSREANAALLAQSLIKTVPYPVFQIKAFPGETQLPISATLVVLFLKHHHNSLVPSKTSKLLLNAVVRNPTQWHWMSVNTKLPFQKLIEEISSLNCDTVCQTYFSMQEDMHRSEEVYRGLFCEAMSLNWIYLDLCITT